LPFFAHQDNETIVSGALSGFSVELDEELFRETLFRASAIHKVRAAPSNVVAFQTAPT